MHTEFLSEFVSLPPFITLAKAEGCVLGAMPQTCGGVTIALFHGGDITQVADLDRASVDSLLATLESRAAGRVDQPGLVITGPDDYVVAVTPAEATVRDVTVEFISKEASVDLFLRADDIQKFVNSVRSRVATEN